MNTRTFLRRDFADTLAAGAAHTGSFRLGQADAIEQMARADESDWTLLTLVLCTTAATLLLALACSLAA